MDDESEHDLLPWHIVGDLIHASDRSLVAEVLGPFEANARLIVTAVNAHAELLAAAKKALDEASEDHSAAVELILQAAIAKAEEQAS